MTTLRGTACAAVLALGSIAFSGIGTAQAEELRIAIGMPPGNSLTAGMEKFAANLEEQTGGEYSGKVYPGTLLNFAESLTGVRDGIADVAYIVPAYHRGEFPNGNLVSDAATLTTDPIVAVGAVNEYMMMHCPACLSEYKAQGQVFMGTAVIGPYYLMSKDKMESLADFAGKKYRGFGPFGRWVETMGGSPIVLSANDIYESISQGQLDGNVHTVDTLKSLSIGEVVDYILLQPVGLYTGNSMFDLNRDIWDELSEERKRQFLLAAGDAIGFTTVQYLADNMAYLADPASVGVEVVEPSAEIVAATEAFYKADLDTVAKLNVEKYGVADAAEQIAELQTLVSRWEGLVAGIDKTDPAAVGALLNEEVFGKVPLDSL